MDAAAWQTARKLFREALERDPATWDRFLAEACEDDPDLREEVRNLLASYQESEDFLEDAAAAESRKDPFEGRQLGAYKLVRCLEHGGMGMVYLAVRADDQFQKRVALKILRRGLFSEDLVRRFHVERQILAALSHSNIARLLDGGTTEEGLPYLVMEYVEGKPIDEYCDHHGLAVAKRLKLFGQVCAAVQFAHQNLVVHCDLKPANILVSPDGSPKLLDFGIAKLLNPELSGRTLVPTAAHRLMTPEYASPEQANEEPITTAADVYSLGVLLYFLLTGHRPYQIKGSSPLEIVRVISTEEPVPPSSVVLQQGSRKDLHKLLAGDLDNIVLKALHKEPGGRYSSVEQLADDLRRHLEGRPVLARKATLAYRSGKFVRRHRFGVAAVTSFIVAILCFGIVMAVQRNEIARQRDRAQQVKAFLVGLFEVSDPLRSTGDTLTAREILDKGALRIESELGEQPEIRAELLDTIGVIFLRLGIFDRSGQLLESALETRREELGEMHADVARSLSHLAELRMEQGSYDSAKALLQESLTIRRRRLGEKSLEVAESLNDLGKLFQYEGNLKEAETRYREALAMRAHFLGAAHVEVAETLNNLATVLWAQGDFTAAVPLHRQALDMRRRLLGDENVEVSESLNNLGIALRDMGSYEEARSCFEQALKLRISLLGEAHPRVGTAFNNLAGVLLDQGDYAAAEPLFEKALAIYRQALGDRHPNVAAALTNLARLNEERGEVEEAKARLEEAVAIARETGAFLDRALTQLAGLLESQGAFDAAEPLAREALDLLRKSLPPDHWRIAAAESVVAGCLVGRGRLEAAEALLVHSVPILEASHSRQAALRLRSAAERLAQIYEASGEQEKAARYRGMAITP